MIGKNRRLLLSVAWQGNKVYESMCAGLSAEYGLTQNEIDVLSFLSTFHDLNTAKDIAKYRVISKSLICKSVKSLVDRGFLSCEQDGEDKRLIHLYITEEAKPAADKIVKTRSEFIKFMYRGVTPEEEKVLASVLNKISANLETSLQLKE